MKSANLLKLSRTEKENAIFSFLKSQKGVFKCEGCYFALQPSFPEPGSTLIEYVDAVQYNAYTSPREWSFNSVSQPLSKPLLNTTPYWVGVPSCIRQVKNNNIYRNEDFLFRTPIFGWGSQIVPPAQRIIWFPVVERAAHSSLNLGFRDTVSRAYRLLREEAEKFLLQKKEVRLDKKAKALGYENAQAYISFLREEEAVNEKVKVLGNQVQKLMDFTEALKIYESKKLLLEREGNLQVYSSRTLTSLGSATRALKILNGAMAMDIKTAKILPEKSNDRR